MTFIGNHSRAIGLAAVSAALVALSACGDSERSAEAETPISEAEISTELPESVLSDNQLEATANAAAELAATPPGQVVGVPVAPDGSAGGVTATNQMGNTTVR